MGTVTLATWAAVAGPILAVLGAVGRWLARKLDQVGEHLRRQDEAHQQLRDQVAADHRALGERLSRLEGPVKRIDQRTAEGT